MTRSFFLFYFLFFEDDLARREVLGVKDAQLLDDDLEFSKRQRPSIFRISRRYIEELSFSQTSGSLINSCLGRSLVPKKMVFKKIENRPMVLKQKWYSKKLKIDQWY